MIADQETNYVFFSELILRRHSGFMEGLKAVLKQRNISYGFLSRTRDIWCRDYMPIQVARNGFVQFKYDPIYLKAKAYRKTRTDAAETCKAIDLNPMVSCIKLDGGNVVKSRTKAIMTRRIFSENSGYPENRLIEELKRFLKVKEIIIIPECPHDRYGHSDGMIRFCDGITDETMVFVNDFSEEDPAFVSEFREALSTHGLRPLLLPCTAYHNKGDNAAGIYVNYLQVGKTVIYPVYGQKEDALARNVFFKRYGANAIPIQANAIAKEGGVLNCVSWNVKRWNSFNPQAA